VADDPAIRRGKNAPLAVVEGTRLAFLLFETPSPEVSLRHGQPKQPSTELDHELRSENLEV
jgi:hypothetical protein